MGKDYIPSSDIGFDAWFDRRMRLGPLGDPITVAISP